MKKLHFIVPMIVISSMATLAEDTEIGAVATSHPLATESGMEILREGGNAIDAAVAIGLTLGVVDGYNSTIGGGCFILIRLASGEVVAIDGRETAPSAATRSMYLRDGKAVAELSLKGALAIGVPGALAAYDLALRDYGTMKLGALLERAAEIAETGFPIDALYADRLSGAANELREFLPDNSPFFVDGKPLAKGATLKQPNLAGTYRAIAREGTSWFYGGPFAGKLEQWMETHGGIMTAADLRDYKPKKREPVKSTYRGYQVFSFPPPSSGGVHVIQILNMLETRDVPSMQPNGAEFLHLAAESMKRAFADRAYWLGDPDFTPVPRGLLDKGYAAELAQNISEDECTPVTSHGTPPDAKTDFFRKHTTHFSVADVKGNWVAITATINTPFGSKVVIPGTGVFMNNEMDDFSVEPGVPNYFGLVGGVANEIRPGKRPLSSMSPTIVLKEGEPVVSLGAAGGPTIITQTVLNLVRMLDFGMTAEDALAAPRIHHQWLPDTLKVEAALPEKTRRQLRAKGHKVEVVPEIGASQIVARMPGEKFEAVSDPRIQDAGAVE